MLTLRYKADKKSATSMQFFPVDCRASAENPNEFPGGTKTHDWIVFCDLKPVASFPLGVV